MFEYQYSNVETYNTFMENDRFVIGNCVRRHAL